MINPVGAWLDLREVTLGGPGAKTRRFGVHRKAGNLLGHIRWYSPWRRYVFYPRPQVLFDAACLTDIQIWLKALMDERKAQ